MVSTVRFGGNSVERAVNGRPFMIKQPEPTFRSVISNHFYSVFAAMIGTFADGLPEPLHGLQPRANELSLAEWQRNFRHGSLPHTRHAPRGLAFLWCICPPVPRSFTASQCRRIDGAATRRSVGQGTARQPQARAPKQFALNRRHIRKNRIAGFQVKAGSGRSKNGLLPLGGYDVTFNKHFPCIEGTGFSCDRPPPILFTNDQDRTSNRTCRSHPDRQKNRGSIPGCSWRARLQRD
jgi:hypothetical protein